MNMTNLKKQYLSLTFSGNKSGFSLVEIMIAVAIIGLMAAVSVPVVSAWLPNYRLKSAARDLHSALQNARILAVKRNVNVRIVFDNTVNPGFYFLDLNGNDTMDQPGEFRTDLGGYGSGVDFGMPAGIVNWNGAIVANAVTYPGGPPPFCTYNTNGTSGNGDVYLMNQEAHIVYAVTTVISGAVKLRKYNGILPYNQNNWIE